MVTLRTTLLLIILLFAAARQQAQTVIAGGNVSGNWDAEGNPYLIEGNITLNPEDKLTIKPGVQVLFEGNYSFEIYGRLDANGTEEGKILFSLSDTTGFAEGTAGWSGLAFLGYYSELLENSVMNHCIVEYSAGNGVTCLDYPTLSVSHAEIRHNKYQGFVIYEFSDIEMHGVHVHHNGTGGMKVQFSGVQLTDFLIEENNGTGISMMGHSYSSNSTFLQNGIIRNNYSGQLGGGLNVLMESFVDLEDVSIYGNSALYGGGIYTTFGSIGLTSVEIYGNNAQYGGGIYCDSESNLVMEHCVVSTNTAEEDGGALWLTDTDLDIDRSTISGNTAGNSGGALFYQLYFGQAGTISNSILWGNYPDEIIAVMEGPQVNYSDVAGGYAGEGNIDANPVFENAEDGNYHLTWADFPDDNGFKSPCIDAGNPQAAFDADGTVADMGAYYFDQETMTATKETLEASFKMYPNPASEVIHLDAETDISKISIMTMSGQLVHEQTLGGSTGRISIGHLVPGLYILQVTMVNGAVTTGKLVRE